MFLVSAAGTQTFAAQSSKAMPFAAFGLRESGHSLQHIARILSIIMAPRHGGLISPKLTQQCDHEDSSQEV